MPRHSHPLGLAAPLAALIAAAVALPAQAQAEHEGRYFGFRYHPYTQYPPIVYPPPPRVRETAPGVYEYEVRPGHWVRMRPGYGYEPPRRSVRTPPPSRQARPEPSPPPVPQSKPDPADEPSVAARNAPATVTPERIPEQRTRQSTIQDEAALQAPERTVEEQTAARAPEQTETASGGGISCEAAAEIVENFGFSDVQSTSCSGDTYGFDASRDGSSYAIRLNADTGELTEVSRR